ncbi:hypothetical protein ACIGMX_34980 [Streptomyces aquilus]|uniref:hypothetical protein n=1 Tax=Streptomyces aquilus TaxID=2548456 RepID=UPI0037D2873F
MTRRTLAPTVAYVAEVTVIALAAAWISSWSLDSQAVAISAGATAAWLAGMFLPCPCHPKGGRR